MIIFYDNKFNSNEWFVIISLTIGIILLWIFRKGMPVKELIMYAFFGFFIGNFMDHTISILPFDFYDVNDNSSYQFMDFLTYVAYGPFSYLYIYIYDHFKIKLSHTPIYIMLWSFISLGMESMAHYMGVFHYKNGYKIYYSFPIYLLVMTIYICLYKMIESIKNKKFS